MGREGHWKCLIGDTVGSLTAWARASWQLLKEESPPSPRESGKWHLPGRSAVGRGMVDLVQKGAAISKEMVAQGAVKSAELAERGCHQIEAIGWKSWHVRVSWGDTAGRELSKHYERKL